jgi:hypothetical protein
MHIARPRYRRITEQDAMPPATRHYPRVATGLTSTNRCHRSLVNIVAGSSNCLELRDRHGQAAQEAKGCGRIPPDDGGMDHFLDYP